MAKTNNLAPALVKYWAEHTKVTPVEPGEPISWIDVVKDSKGDPKGKSRGTVGKHTTPDKYPKACALLDQGNNVYEIARLLDVHWQTIQSYKARYFAEQRVEYQNDKPMYQDKNYTRIRLRKQYDPVKNNYHDGARKEHEDPFEWMDEQEIEIELI